VNEASSKQQLTGWGRTAPRECQVYRPEQRRALGNILSSGAQRDYIARGLGRSYGDTAVNGGGGVVLQERLNRMLDFDAKTGVLECEAGVTLEEIIEVFLPRGFFLPVTPGTKFVTVGGAIANDVHGKSHHRDGAFGQYVHSLELLLPSGEIMTCSPEENEDVFWATVGGIGLTGIILSARIGLQPVESAYILVDYLKAKDLDTALAGMAESDEDYQYSVAWLDGLARGGRLGRSILMRGNHATLAQLPPERRDKPYTIPARRSKSVPFDFPGFVLNPLSVKAFNTFFYAYHRSQSGVLTDYDSFFYPLDGIHQWNRMYGKAGFVQYQATLPPSGVPGVVALLEKLTASRRASFLAVLKCFGAGNPGLLSHPMKGYTLALDLPMRPGLDELLRELDVILLDHGGRLYLAKDSSTDAAAFAAMYPELGRFQAIIERLDPNHVLSSDMARRLGIVPEREGVKPWQIP
jgi:decaprenylphospho-beta-D-ribofuranose 2-oxidase